jgi:histone acetyltransferase (RNA polymerase elongator complex component)
MASCSGSRKKDAVLNIEDLMDAITPYRTITEVDTLKQLVREIVSIPDITPIQADKIIHDKICEFKQKKLGIDSTQINNINLLFIYRLLCNNKFEKEFEYNPNMEAIFRTKKMRSLSGVIVVALFTHPYPETSKGVQEFSCQYDCFFCPRPIVIDPVTGQKKEYPRSYVPDGPATRRADRNNFDTIDQFIDRARTYIILGHPLDKLEIIVLGGTWHSYPLEYRENFIRDIYWSANNFFAIIKAKLNKLDLPPKKSMKEEIAQNRFPNVDIHIIGFTIETRPDQLSPKSIIELRDQGVTRIQAGIQHIDDRVLKRNNRRCTNKHNTIAIMLAMSMCMKIDTHYMPDLVKPLTREGQLRIDAEIAKLSKDDPEYNDKVREILLTVDPNTEVDHEFDMVEADRKMFKYLIVHHWGDEWKIYPMEAVDWTPIPQWRELGIHRSYFEDYDFSKLKNGEWKKMNDKKKKKYRQTHNPYHYLMLDVLPEIPPEIRVTRLNRDIPVDNIRGGNDAINGRQYIENDVIKMGRQIKEMRYREIKGKNFDASKAALKLRPYWVYGEDPKFSCLQIMFEFSDPETDTLYGFLRLGFQPTIIPEFFKKKIDKYAPELNGCGMIRELHVYGQMTEVGKSSGNTQHQKFGTHMIQAAEYFAYHYLGVRKMAVVSGEGVKEYYTNYGRRYCDEFKIKSDWTKYGYHDEGHYMIKKFPEAPKISKYLFDMMKPQLLNVANTRNPFTNETSFPLELLNQSSSDGSKFLIIAILFIGMIGIIIFRLNLFFQNSLNKIKY